MPSFDSYQKYNRTLFVRFNCSRCGYEEFESLKDCDKRTGERGDFLHQLFLPDGWTENRFGNIVLCPNCTNAFNEFMKEGADNG